MSLLQMIKSSGDVVTRRVSSAAFQWMLAVSEAVDGIVASGTQAETRYVDKAGNDATGDGSFDNPFLTVQAAITSITDAASTKPYGVLVAPGVFATAFTIQPWIFVVGAGIDVTYLAPTAAQVLGSGFAGAGTKLSGISNATITTNLITNFATIASTGAGKVNYIDLNFLGTCVLTGATATNNAFFQNTGWLGVSGIGKNMTINNMANVDMIGCSGGFGNLIINGNGAFFQEVQGAGSGTFFDLTIAWTGAVAANALDCSFDSPPCLNQPSVTGLGAIYYCSGGQIFYNLIANSDIQFDPFTGLGAAGALIGCENGTTHLSINSPGGDVTVILRRPTSGTGVTIKNQTSNYVNLTFNGAVIFPGAPSYVRPLGWIELIYSGGVWFSETQTQTGTVTLSNGVSPLIPADISTGSNIVATLRDFNGGVLGVMVCAKQAGRINGSRAGGGGFVLTSVTAAGVTVATDQGIYDWLVAPGRV